MQAKTQTLEILLVDDNSSDARLTAEAFKESTLDVHFSMARDGVEALAFLRREAQYTAVPQPDLVLLDLNMPRKGGHEVLQDLKSDPALRHIPVIILTTSQANWDIARTYDLHANCYITKPVDLDQFFLVARAIEDFWLSTVTLPSDYV